MNAYVSHTDLLEHLHLPVSTVLPATTRCPSCDGNLHVDQDILDLPRGCWYRCPDCQFTGDSIQLYQQAKEIQDVRQAINAMRDEGIDFSEYSESLVRNYLVIFREKRRRMSEFWQKSRANLFDGVYQQDRLTLLDKYGLDLGSGTDYREWLTANVGLATSELVNTVIANCLGEAARWRGRALVLSYQGAPGRNRGLCFAGARGPVFSELKLPNTPADNGIAFLDALAPSEDVVYAVANPFVAANLQMSHLESLGSPMPLIAFQTHTAESWYYARAGATFFWVPEVSPAMFNNVLRAYNPYISMDTEFLTQGKPREVYQRLRSFTLNQLTNRIYQHRRKWPEVLRDQILADPGEAVHFISQIHLDPEQRDEVLRCCRGQLELRLVRGYLELPEITHQIELHGQTIEERHDGYYHIQPRDRVVQISNFTLGRTTIVRISALDETRITGAVCKDGVDVQYSGLRHDILKDPQEWLQTQVLDAGKGMLSLDKKWKNEIYDICFAMAPPEQFVVAGISGWNPKLKGYSFPQFNIQRGRLEPLPLTDVDLPCTAIDAGYTGLTRTEYRGIHARFSRNKADIRAAWAFFIVFIHNILAVQLDWLPVTLGLVTSATGERHRSGRALTKIFGCSWFMTGLHHHQWYNLLNEKLERTNGVPLAIDVPKHVGDPTLSWLASDMTMSAVVPVTAHAAEVGRILRPDWVFLEDGYATEDTARVAHINLFVAEFLAWFQRHQYQLQPGATTLRTVFNTVRHWAVATFLNRQSRNVLEQLDTVFETIDTTMLSQLPLPTMGERLVQLLVTFYYAGKLPRYATDARTALCGIDVQRPAVILRPAVLAQVFKRAGYPFPSGDRVTEYLHLADKIMPGEGVHKSKIELDYTRVWAPMRKYLAVADTRSSAASSAQPLEPESSECQSSSPDSDTAD